MLPRYNNKIYLMMEMGEHFGHVDMAIEKEMLDLDIRFSTRTLKKHNILRRFTLQAVENCDTYILRLDDLEKLRFEFPEMFSELFLGANDRLKCELLLKLEVINKCEASVDGNVDIRARFAKLFTYGVNAQNG